MWRSEQLKFIEHYSVLGILRAKYHGVPKLGLELSTLKGFQQKAALESETFQWNTLRSPPCLSGGRRDYCMQTQCRDSETQTDPYSPEYVFPIGQSPKVLLLTHLNFGSGLPVSQNEVELIGRAEERRIVEAKMDSLLSACRTRLRNRLELDEWRHRAREIEALQEIRLQIIAQLLHIREENRQKMNAKRLDRRWNLQQKEKSEIAKKVRNEYASAIRKMLCAMERGHNLKPDKIEQYSQPGSQAFAPLTRLGVFPDHGAERFKMHSKFLDTYAGLLQLEKFIPESVVDAKIIVRKFPHYTKDGYLKRKFRWRAQLESLHKHMGSLGTKNVNPSRPLRFLFKIDKPAPRPSTPSVPEIDRIRDEGEVAVLHLQRLIRGRALQTMMYESRRKRQLLVNELRSTHALTKEERAEKRRQMLTTRTNQTRYEHLQHENSLSHEVLERLDSAVLGAMLDLLSKELDRLLVDQRLHEYVQRARNERRMREIEETGRRQWEERRRREHDEFFRQVIKVHQDAVDGYFSALIATAMETSAELLASKEFEKIAELWSDEVCCAEQRLTHEEEAAELVYNFLIPEVNRRCYREILQRHQRKYLSAAHHELFDEIESASLGANIRHYQGLLKDNVTSAANVEEERGKPPELQDVLELEHLKGHDYNCEG
ncbi:Cilia and flagella-associated protein 91 [Taenia crassiceps]|uniref:Cilia- and flagella-associated protein 91 n=1 Tax=Taenia crassiceps TaxID=6207 RepID=A0ABR4Q3K6_9CEST